MLARNHLPLYGEKEVALLSQKPVKLLKFEAYAKASQDFLNSPFDACSWISLRFKLQERVSKEAFS